MAELAMACEVEPNARGSEAGRSRHRRAGQPVCDDCRDAQNERARERRRALPSRRTRLATCGDRRGDAAGAHRHKRRGEKPCVECRKAYAVEQAVRKAKIAKAAANG